MEVIEQLVKPAEADLARLIVEDAESELRTRDAIVPADAAEPGGADAVDPVKTEGADVVDPEGADALLPGGADAVEPATARSIHLSNNSGVKQVSGHVKKTATIMQLLVELGKAQKALRSQKSVSGSGRHALQNGLESVVVE